MRKSYLLILLASLALACGTTTVVTPTADVNAIVAQTFAALTVEAALTQGAPTTHPTAPPPTQPPPPPTPLPTQPSPTSPPTQPPPPTPSPTPQEVAPDPLPAMNTGIILNNGECFNFDNGQTLPAPDTQCDVWLAESALFRQMNGAQISGYVTMTPPTRSQCLAGRYEPGDLAVQTDMYMCFITNEGNVGFIVVREYRGAPIFTGIVFDYWVFR